MTIPLSFRVGWYWMLGVGVSFLVLENQGRAQSSELRDPAVLYLDQALPVPIQLQLLDAADVYSDKEGSLRLVTLPKGQMISVIAVYSSLIDIQTTFAGNKVVGWIDAAKLPPLDPKLLDNARKVQAFRDAVAQAIKDKKVIEGMTLEDVQNSLGKPNSTSFRKDATHQINVWHYTTYESVPQYTTGVNGYGQTIQTLTYVKVPVGDTIVEFTDGRVTAVEQHAQNANARGVTVP